MNLVRRIGAARLLFAVGAVGLAVMLASAIPRLPDFGHTPHPYGVRAVAAAVSQHTANAVGSVTFDQRAFDTMGEEFILFSAAVGTVLLLRRMRQEDEDEHGHGYGPEDVFEGVRMAGYLMLPVTGLVGAYVVVHGHLSPGGGFQGGVVLATGLHLAYLAGDYRALERLRPVGAFDVTEAVGALAFVALGLAALAGGAAFLTNILPLGSFNSLLSAGTVPVLNVVVGFEVGSAIVLVVAKFLEQSLLVRGGED